MSSYVNICYNDSDLYIKALVNFQTKDNYAYTYPDGTERTLYGYTSLIFMPLVQTENVSEIKDALKKQDDYYRKWFNI